MIDDVNNNNHDDDDNNNDDVNYNFDSYDIEDNA
jgi:hypothetical protein